MFETRCEEFQATFAEGFIKYIYGEWESAHDLFNQALALIPDDGPSKTLLGVMREHDFQAPEEWDGYRELTEK